MTADVALLFACVVFAAGYLAGSFVTLARLRVAYEEFRGDQITDHMP